MIMVDVDPRFEAWLSHETGIDAPSLGQNTLERAVLDRTRAMLAAQGMSNGVDAAALDAYWLRLNTSPEERQALIEALVVPETWFFRDREAFVTLARMAGEKLVREPMRVLRILSAPCSTGEEPYSAAMALLDAGIEPARFTIDAIDISARALELAKRAVYGRNAFRGHPLTFRERHFIEAEGEGGWQLSEAVRACVRFAQANLSDAPADDTRYDFIFCRNVLIYFHRSAQDQAIRRLDAQLADDGMIFVGPAETGLMMRHAMSSARIPLAFAFQRTPAGEATVRTALPFRLPLPPESQAPLAAAPMGLPGVVLPRVPVRPVATRVPASMSVPASAARVVAKPLPLPVVPEPVVLPDLAEAHRLADAGRLDEAEQVALEIANLRAPEAPTFYLLGLIADARGRHADAGDFYRKTLYLEPAHYEALTHLAALLGVAGDTVGARQLMLRAERALARQGRALAASSDTPEHTRGTHGARRP